MSPFDDERRMQPIMDNWYTSHGATSVDRSVSSKKHDCVILHENGKTYRIEEKYLLTEPYAKGLIEIIQDVETYDAGWFYHVDCDFLVWVYCGKDNGRNGGDVEDFKELYVITWSLLRSFVFQGLRAVDWQDFQICSDGYGITLNYPVSWSSLVEKNIARKYTCATPEGQT